MWFQQERPQSKGQTRQPAGARFAEEGYSQADERNIRARSNRLTLDRLEVRVTRIQAGGQADARGIMVSMRVCNVDGMEEVSHGLLRDKCKGSDGFSSVVEAVFEEATGKGVATEGAAVTSSSHEKIQEKMGQRRAICESTST